MKPEVRRQRSTEGGGARTRASCAATCPGGTSCAARQDSRAPRSRRPAWGRCSPRAPRTSDTGGTSPSGERRRGRRSSRAARCRRRSPENRTRSIPRRPRSTRAPRCTTTSSASSSTSTPTDRSSGELATKWTADDDTTWVFDLVDNATFHNGEAFTADDVKYTFERILDPEDRELVLAAVRHDQERRGRVPDPGRLPPQDAVRTVPVATWRTTARS